MKRNRLLLICLFILTAFAGNAQSQKLNGVYVGAELYTTPFEGMQINNIVLYFRNDGTFSDQLNTTNWRTNVSGSYSIKDGLVALTFKSGKEGAKYKLQASGGLESTAGIKHVLHKVKPVTSLPAATYERKTASNRGGMGTGAPNVFAGSSQYLYFDGKGHFSFDRSGIVGIGGDVAGGTIGGKTETNKAATGTYKLGDGEITLTLNGTTSKHSFFYSPPNEEDLIVVDGDFYFRADEQGAATINATTNNAPKEQRNTSTTTGLPTATDLLNKLRSIYGGQNIDKITTLRETSTLTGNLQAVVLTDIGKNKIRAEIRQQGKLLLVKQLEGSEGWQWMNGIKKALTQDEKTDMQLSLYQGVLGLHTKLNKQFLTGTIAESKGDYMLTFLINDSKVIYFVGSDYTLKGNAYSINGTPNISVYKNFIKTGGITVPGTTESSDGKNKLIINTTSTEINPVFSDDNWKMP